MQDYSRVTLDNSTSCESLLSYLNHYWEQGKVYYMVLENQDHTQLGSLLKQIQKKSFYSFVFISYRHSSLDLIARIKRFGQLESLYLKPSLPLGHSKELCVGNFENQVLKSFSFEKNRADDKAILEQIQQYPETFIEITYKQAQLSLCSLESLNMTLRYLDNILTIIGKPTSSYLAARLLKWLAYEQIQRLPT